MKADLEHPPHDLCNLWKKSCLASVGHHCQAYIVVKLHILDPVSVECMLVLRDICP